MSKLLHRRDKGSEYNPAEDPYLQERIKEIEWYLEHGYSKITILQELCFEGTMKPLDAQALYQYWENTQKEQP